MKTKPVHVVGDRIRLPGHDPFAQIIASRPLRWVDQDGRTNTALVEIGCPYPNPGGVPNAPDDPWCCGVRLTGLLSDNFQPVFFGTDSLSALLQAISHAGVAVNGVAFAPGLDWAVAPYCGFPIYPAPMEEEQGGGGEGGGPITVECGQGPELEPIDDTSN